MKRKQNKKAQTLLVCLAALAIVTVGKTLAILMDSSSTVKNEFTPAQVSCQVEEVFDGEVKSNVQIRNTGNTEAYIRAAVILTWKNGNNEVYAATPSDGGDCVILWNLSDDGWVKGADGFYYYTKEVSPCNHSGGQAHNECLTSKLINSCSPIDGKAPEGYSLSVEIVASAIQSAPDHVVEGEWTNAMVTVKSNDGTLTITSNGG